MSLKEEVRGVLVYTDNKLIMFIVAILFLLIAILFTKFRNFDVGEIQSLVPPLVGIAGLFMLYNWKKVKISFDKNENYLYKLTKGLFGKTEEKYTLSLTTSVEYVEKVPIKYSTKGINIFLCKEINIVFSNGVKYSLYKKNNLFLLSSLGKSSKQDMAQKIASFVGIPFVSKTYEDLLNKLNSEFFNSADNAQTDAIVEK